MAEQVITEFILNTQNFDANLERATRGMVGYDKAAEEAEKENKNLGGSMGNLGAKFKETKTVADGAGKGIADMGKATAESGGLVNTFKGKLDSTFPIFGKIAGGARALGTAIYTALGPIGLIIGAVVLAFGALVKIFAGTQEGMDRISKVIEPLKAQFQATIGLLQTIGKVAADTVSLLFDVATFNFDGAAESFEALKGSAEQAGAEIGNFGNTLTEAAAKGARLAEIKKELDEVSLSIAENESRINREFQEQKSIVSNVGASAKERNEAAAEAIRLQRELTALKVKELDVQIEQLEIQQSLNDTSREEKIALAKLKAQRDDIRAQEVAATREVANVVSALNKAAADKAIAEAKRVSDERKKAADEAAKTEAERVKAFEAAEAQLGKLADDARRKRELAALSASDREVAILEDGYAKQVEAAKDAFEKLAALAPAGPQGDDERAEAAKVQAQALTDIEAQKNADLEALRARDLESTRAALLSKQELEREAINTAQNELAAEVERLYADGEAKTAALEQIERDRQERLAGIITEAQQAELDRLQSQQEQQAELISGFGSQLAQLSGEIAAGQIKGAKETSKALASIALTSVGQIVQAKIVELVANLVSAGSKVGPVGAAAGLAAGGVFSAILQGLLNKLKAQTPGAYTGEREIGANGEAPTWSGRDGYLRRVHRGESIIAADKVKKYRGAIEAIHDGRLEQWVESSTAVTNYVTHGPAISNTTAPRLNDSRIVGALAGVGSMAEQRKQTELLAAIAAGFGANRSKRYRA